MRHGLARPRRVPRFVRDEDGSMVIFSMFVFLMMLMVAGMAVDLMRYESVRSRLQATLDGAVLAATDLDQIYQNGRTPRGVVENRFKIVGLFDQLRSINVVETINSRTVSADADLALDTYFMDLVGVPELVAPAAGRAIESVSDIEIVLVLDVSASMADAASDGRSKIVNLREAARDFVQTVLENDTQKRVSVAVVPFNAQVNLGPQLRARYPSIVAQSAVAGMDCVDLNLPDRRLPNQSLYAQPGIDRYAELYQAGYFDGYSTTTQSHTAYVTPQSMSTGNLVCRSEPKNLVRVPSQNITTLRSQMQQLQAAGNTSITYGMKWGLALLDPGTQGVFTGLVAGGQMPSTLAGRPYAYDRDNTLKIIVLMTDGMHYSSPSLNLGYRTEASNLAYVGSGTSAVWSAYYDRPNTPYDWWTPSPNFDTNSTNVSWPGIVRNSRDDDNDGTVDDNVPGAWRVLPFDGSVDEDTDGPQFKNGVLVTICDDDNNDGRDDHTGTGPCDDDDYNDDGRDDGLAAEDSLPESDVDVDGTATVIRPTWAQVWTQARVSWVAWQLNARAQCAASSASAANTCRTNAFLAAFGRQETFATDLSPTPNVTGRNGTYLTWTTADGMDATLLQSCTLAKQNGVVVYTIAYEAPPRSQDLFEDCASTRAHFFNADDADFDITEAFRAIAAQINQLRLEL